MIKRLSSVRNRHLKFEIVCEAVLEDEDEDDGAEESSGPLEDGENSGKTFSSLQRIGNRVSVLLCSRH